jgi:serine/threonine protein kinase
MTLAAGSRLGPYEIVAPIGAGGMGEVYRAKDPRLGRDVAPDGKGFCALLQSPDSGVVKELRLVTNWLEELNRLAPVGRK